MYKTYCIQNNIPTLIYSITCPSVQLFNDNIFVHALQDAGDSGQQTWELAADPWISVGKKKVRPPKIKRSAQIRM